MGLSNVSSRSAVCGLRLLWEYLTIATDGRNCYEGWDGDAMSRSISSLKLAVASTIMGCMWSRLRKTS